VVNVLFSFSGEPTVNSEDPERNIPNNHASVQGAKKTRLLGRHSFRISELKAEAFRSVCIYLGSAFVLFFDKQKKFNEAYPVKRHYADQLKGQLTSRASNWHATCHNIQIGSDFVKEHTRRGSIVRRHTFMGQPSPPARMRDRIKVDRTHDRLSCSIKRKRTPRGT
jgi:hypothetical protein